MDCFFDREQEEREKKRIAQLIKDKMAQEKKLYEEKRQREEKERYKIVLEIIFEKQWAIPAFNLAARGRMGCKVSIIDYTEKKLNCRLVNTE